MARTIFGLRSKQWTSLRGVLGSLVLLLVVLDSRTFPAAAQFDIEGAKESVVRIHASHADGSTSWGTGFVINDKRHVITNYHVIEGSVELIAGFRSKPRDEIVGLRVVFADPDKDIAVLEARADLLGEPLALAIGEITETTDVFAVGFPGAADIVGTDLPQILTPTVNKGNVSRTVLSNQFNARVIQHTASINGGNSGGPLYDSCNRVVGINWFKPSANQNAEGIFFAIHAEELARLLKGRLIPFEGQSGACSPTQVVQLDQAPSAADIERERDAYARFAACANRFPCMPSVCLRHYKAKSPGRLVAARSEDLAYIGNVTRDRCLETTEALAFEELEACSRKSACEFASQCEAPYRTAVDAGLAVPRSENIEQLKKDAAAACPASTSGQQPVPVVPKSPATSAFSKVPPRVYHGSMEFEVSADNSQERLRGNCGFSKVRIVVDNTFQLVWDYREATRRSRWVGRVDPLTGAIEVVAAGVQISGNDGLPLQATPGATARGAFADAQVHFPPCGGGRLSVLN